MRLALVLAVLTIHTASFSDPAGDAPGAPDITRVTAAHNATTLTVTIATVSAADWQGSVAFLNFDTNGSGSSNVTYTLHSEHNLVTRDTPGGALPTNATATLSGSTLVYAVPLSELGNRATLGMSVTTAGMSGQDEAPDGGGFWQVAVRTSVVFAPARPVHGRRFRVSGGTGCRARIGASALKGTCSWLIPAWAKGRTLLVSAVVDGSRRNYRFVIR